MSFAAIILALCHAAATRRTRARARTTPRALLARGAVEVGAGHYPLIVSLHAAWLIALWIWGRDQAVNPVALAAIRRAAGLAGMGACDARAALDDAHHRAAGRAAGASGPYRYLSHPNYVVVVGEIALLPLALHLPLVALVFTVLERCRADDPDPRRERARSQSSRECAPAGCMNGRPKAARSTRRAPGSALPPMCLGMFMAILDVQVVATSLPTIQRALGSRPDADELDPDRLSDRRSHRDPADRLVHAPADACAGCSSSRSRLHARLDRLRLQRQISPCCWSLARACRAFPAAR